VVGERLPNEEVLMWCKSRPKAINMAATDAALRARSKGKEAAIEAFEHKEAKSKEFLRDWEAKRKAEPEYR
jgi:hypothetical protein